MVLKLTCQCLSEEAEGGNESSGPSVITVAPLTGRTWGLGIQLCLLCVRACAHTLTHAELELKSSQVRILVMHLRGLHLTGCYLVMD